MSPLHPLQPRALDRNQPAWEACCFVPASCLLLHPPSCAGAPGHPTSGCRPKEGGSRATRVRSPGVSSWSEEVGGGSPWGGGGESGEGKGRKACCPGGACKQSTALPAQAQLPLGACWGPQPFSPAGRGQGWDRLPLLRRPRPQAGRAPLPPAPGAWRAGWGERCGGGSGGSGGSGGALRAPAGAEAGSALAPAQARPQPEPEAGGARRAPAAGLGV